MDKRLEEGAGLTMSSVPQPDMSPRSQLSKSAWEVFGPFLHHLQRTSLSWRLHRGILQSKLDVLSIIFQSLLRTY